MYATLTSAQNFQWVKRGGGWLGAANGSAVYLRQVGRSLHYKVYGERGWDPAAYFRLDDDYTDITRSVGFDPLVGQLIASQPGLRLIRQDPWETLLMFVCSTNNNYKRIVGMVLSLNSAFGEKVETEFGKVSLFPTPRRLSKASVGELAACGLGYRAKYLLSIAKTIEEEGVDLDSLKTKTYSYAKTALMGLPGVGPKVSDCVCLFSLEKLEAFPIDTWMRRIIARFYRQQVGEELAQVLVDESRSLSPSKYWAVSQKMRDYFGRYAGYAQNQLYYHARRLLEEKRPARRATSSRSGGARHSLA